VKEPRLTGEGYILTPIAGASLKLSGSNHLTPTLLATHKKRAIKAKTKEAKKPRATARESLISFTVSSAQRSRELVSSRRSNLLRSLYDNSKRN